MTCGTPGPSPCTMFVREIIRCTFATELVLGKVQHESMRMCQASRFVELSAQGFTILSISFSVVQANIVMFRFVD